MSLFVLVKPRVNEIRSVIVAILRAFNGYFSSQFSIKNAVYINSWLRTYKMVTVGLMQDLCGEITDKCSGLKRWDFL